MPAPSPAAASPRRRLARAALAVVLGLLVTAVSPGLARAADAGPPALSPGKAWVRVGHFVPGMGAASITLTPRGGGSSITVATGATYGAVTEYAKLEPGSYTASVRMTKAGADSAPLLSRSFDAVGDQARSVAVLGTVSTPRLAVLTDDLTPPEAGTARIRLLSASPAADGVTVAAVDGPTIAEDAVLGQATRYATVPAGTWTLELRGGKGDASATLESVPVASGSVYTIVVLNARRGTSSQQVTLKVISDAAGATAAPRGGAKTGLGGAAPQPVAGLVVLALVTVAGTAAVGVGARLRALRLRR